MPLLSLRNVVDIGEDKVVKLSIFAPCIRQPTWAEERFNLLALSPT